MVGGEFLVKWIERCKFAAVMKEKNEPHYTRRQVASALLVNAGLLLIVVATAMPLLHVTELWIKIVYSAGAAMSIAGRFMNIGEASGVSDLRVRRLMRLETWSTALFAVAVFFMFYPRAGATDWIAFTLAGGFIQAYTSIMINRRMSRKR